LRKINAAVHPDAEITASAGRKAQLLEASQIINGIKPRY